MTTMLSYLANNFHIKPANCNVLTLTYDVSVAIYISTANSADDADVYVVMTANAYTND